METIFETEVTFCTLDRHSQALNVTRLKHTFLPLQMALLYILMVLDFQAWVWKERKKQQKNTINFWLLWSTDKVLQPRVVYRSEYTHWHSGRLQYRWKQFLHLGVVTVALFLQLQARYEAHFVSNHVAFTSSSPPHLFPNGLQSCLYFGLIYKFGLKKSHIIIISTYCSTSAFNCVVTYQHWFPTCLQIGLHNDSKSGGVLRVVHLTLQIPE